MNTTAFRATLGLASTLATLLGCFVPTGSAPERKTPAPTGACAIASIEKLPDPVNLYISPDGTKYVENKQDDAGIYQVYVGETASDAPAVCISCADVPGAPKPSAQKLMISWHPSSQWIFVGGEIDHWRPPYISSAQDLGLMQSGINLDMYATNPNGTVWRQLTQYDPSQAAGYTGPALTPDGKHAYWAEIVDGNIFAYTFGKWRLMTAEVAYDAQGVPSLANTTDITPPNTNWVEPGNVSADGRYLALTLDTGLEPTKAAGMDQWLLELATGKYTNLNDTPKEWDEHGVIAPSSKKLAFMSSHPFSDYDPTFGILGLRTEYMMIDIDGSNLVQLTHFHDPGYPEYTEEDSVAAAPSWSPDGSKLIAAQLLSGAHFPNQVTWMITFAGRCGGEPAP